MSLLDLRDAFTEAQYPKNEQGFSDVPPSDILDWLAQTFPHGYSWHVTGQGFTPTGYAYVTIDLTVQNDGMLMRVPGSAENAPDQPIQMGFSGLTLLALRNAVLRNLGAGHTLYQREPIHREPRPANKTYERSQGNNTRPAADWTGNEPVNIGKYKGTNTTWSEVEDGYLKFVTKGDKPNRNALKEIERRKRQGSPGSGGRAQAVLNNNPFDD